MSTQSAGFRSEPLRAAIEAAHDVIENHAKLRNQVSDDIKNLESYLDSHAPRECFLFSLGENFAPDDDTSFRASMDQWGCGNGEMREEVLAWKPDPKGRFRLFYEVRAWDAEIEVDAPGGPIFGNKSTLRCDSKPLIETSFEVRKAMVHHLPSFVKALASYIAIGSGVQNPEGTEEIPF